jgi:putative chitinase
MAKAEPSNKTKSTASSLKSGVNPKSSPADSQLNNPKEILGAIYDLMVKNREQTIRTRELEQNLQESKKKQEDNQHSEILKALTVRRKPKRVIRREKKAEEKVAKKEPEPTKAPEKKPGETKKAPGKKLEPTKAPEKKPTEVPKKVEPVKEKPAEVPKKVEPAPKAPEPVKPPPKAEPVRPPISAKKAGVLAATGVAGVLASGLAEAGISEKGQANILAQVKGESNFQPKNENLNYTSAKRIFEVFKPPRIPNEKFAEQFVKNPEALANYVYAKTDGNSEPGDGWKYRGRGYVQHTGKNQYKAIKEYTGVDVVSNPDLLNDPKVAIKALAWFFLKYKKLKPQDLDDISKVNRAVGFADKKDDKGVLESDKRKKAAEEFLKSSTASSLPNTSGSQVNQSSAENKDLKDQAARDKAAAINVINQSTNVQQGSQTVASQQKVDDRPAYLRKQNV